VTTFDGAGAGIGLLGDAHGLLAVVLARRAAVDELGLGVGTEVRLVRLDDAPSAAAPAAGPVTTSVQLRPRK
jgi:hypothetical protein